ncbi:hypothetical protein BY457_11072 [Marinilabilia salmonicolor]|jgi:preprotein translocase subunit SecE|uniref:Thivi_2564 family membrane protein n=1 Tax=Marinilabilia salmonicolor TaxID=989 RepID=UPI000D054A1E|nr:Thivi_2564 family membrane protein [Marinilabilia salmonicolor]PRY98260.1 hypothetical protein BY457_11072 [Marinilabilia salmonicolor]
MSALTIIGVIIGVGILLWLINRYIPMQRTIKGVLNTVVVIILILWLLNVIGVLGTLQSIRI